MSKKTGGLSRRNFILTSSVASAGLLMAGHASALLSPPPRTSDTTTRTDGITVTSVRFRNNEIMISGNVYIPRISATTVNTLLLSLSTVVVAFRNRQLDFMPSNWLKKDLSPCRLMPPSGDGGELPRFADDPMKRVVDFYSAVDYLTTLPYVDNNRIGALGVCTGSGITVKASMTERRIKALATVSALGAGAAPRKGWEGTTSESELIPTLDAVAKQRTVEAAGGAPVYVNYVSELGGTSAPQDLQEAADYYQTERGKYPTSTNQMLMTSISTLASFTRFEGADVYLTQPLMILSGSKAGSLWHSQELYKTAASVQKTLHIIPGATHMDLCDGQGATGATGAASKRAPFFKKNHSQV